MNGDNKIKIPWYRTKVNKHIPLKNYTPKHFKFEIKLPEPKGQIKPDTSLVTNPVMENQPSTEFSKEENLYRFPYQIPDVVLTPTGKPQEDEGILSPVISSISENLGQSLTLNIWNTLTTDQKVNTLLKIADTISPMSNDDEIASGIYYAVSYDYSNFNLNEYYNELVDQCGVVTALAIMAITAFLYGNSKIPIL